MTDSTTAVAHEPSLVRRVMLRCMLVAGILLCAFSLLLLQRILSGQLATIGRPTLTIAFVTLIGAMAASRLSATAVFDGHWQVVLAITSGMLVLAAVPLGLLAPTRFDASLFWILLAASDLTWWIWPKTLVLAEDTPVLESQAFAAESCAEEEFEEGVTQTLVRRRMNQVESVEGVLLAEFSEGERRKVMHVAFCPPLPGNPTIESALSIDGAESRIVVGEVRSYGARFEVHLAQTATAACHVRMHFLAQHQEAS